MLEVAAACLVVTALLAYMNARFLGLPITIGVMTAALLLSLLLVGLDTMGIDFGLRQYEESLLRSIDFSNVLMQGMLSMLLFAGALHVDLSELRAYRWQVGLLAVVSTLLSTLAVGFGTWWALPWAGLELSLPYCLLFGALISPTDPIAVMGILKTAGAPKNLDLVIAGESLFNDGVGIVVFTVMILFATGGEGGTVTAPAIAKLLVVEAGGGLLLGILGGIVAYWAMRLIDDYGIEVLITLALVTATYAVAQRLHVSGPLAVVAAGLLIGHHGPRDAMSDQTQKYVFGLWTLIDEILNSVLFLLIGLEVLTLQFDRNTLLIGVIAIPIVIVARFIAMGVPALVTWSSQLMSTLSAVAIAIAPMAPAMSPASALTSAASCA